MTKPYTDEEMREAITFEMGDRFGEVFDLWLENHDKIIRNQQRERVVNVLFPRRSVGE